MSGEEVLSILELELFSDIRVIWSIISDIRVILVKSYGVFREFLLIQVPHWMLPRLRNRLNLEQDLVSVGRPTLEWVAFIIYYIY